MQGARSPAPRLARGVLLIASLTLGVACGSIPRQPFPPGDAQRAVVPGMPEAVRAVGLTPSAPLQRDFTEAMVTGGPQAGCDQRYAQPVFCVLIVSGGGGFGAFGAGVMKGWTASGERPEFKIVTGVSTGGLIAPFAFLGPEWDDTLEQAFTSIESDRDVMRRRTLLGVLRRDSLTRTDPLKARIAEIVSVEMVDAVAREHARGRRLYIGTTNMDAQAFTVWNMGAVAGSGAPDRVALFRRILLASTSIPIVMPPVMIDIEIDGRRYDEMHADGGVQAQFFVPLVVVDLPAAISDAQARGFGYTPTPRMFVIRNSKFLSEPDPIDRSLRAIAARTVSSLVQAMGRADLFQIFAIARARGNDFRYVEVPDDFEWRSDQEFDGPEMRRLFAIGYESGREQVWKRVPPGVFSRNLEEVLVPDD